MNMKDSTLTVIGEADSVSVANMLRRKFRCAEMISGGPMPPPPPPPKEEEKPKEAEKQEEPKKEEEKKEEKPKEEEKKEEEKPKEEKQEEKSLEKEEKPKEEEKKEGNPKEEEEKPEEEKKPEKKEEPVVVAQSALSPHPMWYQACDAQCYPPCSACSSRPEIMWPRYHQPGCGPNEVWYVWNEEKQESCTIM